MNEKIKYRKFRFSILLMTIVLLGMLLLNFFFTIRTPFSGTTYLQLPSPYYITQNISGKLIKKNFSENKKFKSNSKMNEEKKFLDNIPPGSFLLAVNKNYVDLKKFKDSSEAINFLIKLIQSSPDNVQITVLIPNSYPQIEEMSPPSYYLKYSSEYKVDKHELLSGLDNNALLSKKNLSDSYTPVLNNIKYIRDGIFLGYLADGGATDRAGIRSGDILLAVDNVTWKVELNPMENGYFLDYKSLYKLRTQPVGVPLHYKILRENKVIEINVQLATFGIPLKLILDLFLCLLFIFAGWFYAYINPHYLGSRLTGLWLILLGFSIGTSMQIIPLELKLYGTIFSLLKQTVALLTIPLIIHSFTYFPSEIKEITRRKWIHYSIYLIFFVQIILFYITFFAKVNYYNTLIFGLFTLPVLIFYIVIRIIFRKSADKKYRSVGIWMLSMFLAVLILSNLTNFISIEGTTILSILWYLNVVLTGLIPILYILIAWKYRIFDITIKIRKNLQYNLLTVFWLLLMSAATVYAIWTISQLNFSNLNVQLIGSNLEFFSQKNGIKAMTGFEKFIFLIASVIIIFIAYKFTFSIQRIFDAKYFRQKFDYKKSQNELISLIQTNFTLGDLSKIIVEKLSELVHLKRVGIVFYYKQNNSGTGDNSNMEYLPESIFCYDSKIGKDFCSLLNNKFYEELKQFDSIVSIERLPDWMKIVFEENDFKYIIPIMSKKALLGTIYIGEKLSETALAKEDFDFINSITSHISVAIENAFLYEELAKQERIRHELQIARNIQLASLPQTLPHIKGLDVSGISIPAHEVGGDFYDFFNGNGNNLTVVVGDVSGKGTSAALYMSTVQGILRTLNEFKLNPKDLFIRTNRLLYKNIESNSFITAIGANFDFDKKEMLLSRAGHLPLIKYNGKTKKIEYLQTSGIGLGLANEEVFFNSIDELRYKFEKGDIFFFLSDGLSEARNIKMEEFGLDRLTEIIINYSDKSSKFICDEIIKEVKIFSEDTDQYDDITAVVVKITG